MNPAIRRGSAPRRTQRTIVLVEDDPHIALLVKFALESDSVRVETNANGTTGLERILRGPLPDAVILDIMLPDTDGIELLARIRADGRFSTLPVLVTSALDDEISAQRRAADLGARFMRKPFDIDSFAETVGHLMRSDAATA